jgi:NADH-quinone oxidoreductase subunit N
MDTFAALLPATLLTLGVIGVLLADLLTKGRRPGAALSVGIAALVFAGWAALSAAPTDGRLVLGTLRADRFAQVFTVFCCAVGVVSLLATTRGEALRRPGGEFLTLVLCAVLGMSVLSMSVDLVTLYLAFETVSIPSYVLVGMRRADRLANEASMKYVLFGAVSSGLMLFGLSWLVGLAGGTSLEALSAAIANGAAHQPAFFVASALVLAGFAFKISAVPFHFWAPDVYAGAPAAVGGFLAVASKAAGFAALIRVMGALGVSTPTLPREDYLTAFLPQGNAFLAMVAVVALLTMTVGNLAALRQHEIKRLLAWSSIAHAGYLLLALAVWSESALAAVLVYLGAYLFMNLAAFLLAGVLIRELGTGEVSAFRGLGHRSPGLGLAFALVLFSLTGLPPMFGFVAKLTVFYAVFEQGYAWLGVIGLVNGAISLYYYARILASMYLAGPATERADAPRLAISGFDRLLCASLVVPLIVFGVWWNWVLEPARLAVRALIAGGG